VASWALSRCRTSLTRRARTGLTNGSNHCRNLFMSDCPLFAIVSYCIWIFSVCL
jgi:hypothetical protein